MAPLSTAAIRTCRASAACSPQPVTLATTGSVVTANSALAATAGASVYPAGGNAMDAAVATSLAAGVVEPAMSGIAGRGYIVVLQPGSQAAVVIDGHERAPARARPEMFRLAAGSRRIASGWGVEADVVDAANRDGHLAVAVPAVLPALATAHARFGRLPWHALFEPALALAFDGFEVDETLAAAIAANRQRLARFPASAAIFLTDGRPLAAGAVLVQRDLGCSLRRLSMGGPDELRSGALARALVAEMERGGGIVSLDDLARIEPRSWSAAATTTFHGHRILGVPDATGATTLIEIMNMLEDAALDAGMLEPRELHLLAEVFRAAFEDRRRYVDDGEAVAVPYDGLADKRFARARTHTFDREQRPIELATVDPWQFQPGAPAAGRPLRAGPVSDRHTTHFCAVDDQRLVVSMTQSLVDAFGCGVVVPGTGILLNSAMHNFNPVPGELCSVAPWKRAAHFGTPLVVLDPAGRPRLAVGGGGGTKIVTGLAQVLVRVIAGGESLAAAVAAPRIHCDGAAVEADERIFARVQAGLRRRGHRVVRTASRFGAPAFARVNGIEFTATGGLAAAVDVFTDAGAAAADAA